MSSKRALSAALPIVIIISLIGCGGSGNSSTQTPSSPATLTAITVTPATSSIALGTTQQFSARGTYSDGTLKDITSSVAWSSSIASAATINASGLATGAGLGSTTVTATLSGISGNTTLTVTAAALKSIAVTPNAPSIPKGSTQAFTAVGTYTDNSTQTLTSVTWTSSNQNVATISSAGMAAALAAGATMITASSGAVSGTAALSVTAAALVSIAVTPGTASALPGGNQQFTATGTFTDNTTANITGSVNWTSSNQVVATIAATGLASALSSGTSTITANSSGVSGTATLNIPALVSISVSPAIPAINVGLTQAFTAVGTYSDGSSQDVTASATWSSSNTSVATMSGSTATALSFGNSTITAGVSGVSGATTLTVISTPSLTGISITPSTVSLPVNTTQQLVVLGTLSNGSTRDVTASASWSSSASAVATVDAAGLLIVASAGPDVTITATVGSKTASATVHVSSATLQSVLVTPFADTQPTGVEEQFTAAGLFSDGDLYNLAAITWASNATGVASISNSGLATMKSSGTATISATAGAVTGSATLTVKSATLTSISVTPGSASLPLGFPQQFVATGTFSDSTTAVLPVVTWTSSTPGVASISLSGVANALTAGTTTITATSAGISGSTDLAVTSTALKSVAIQPTLPPMLVGETLQFTATATFQDNSTLDVTQSAVWAAFAPAVVSIDKAGLATALTAGASGGVGAGYNTASTSTTATVSAITLTSIAVGPNNPTVSVGTTQQLTATGSYSDSTQKAVGAATWSSADPTIASVSATGQVTARHSGTTTVTATFGGVSGTTMITVP